MDNLKRVMETSRKSKKVKTELEDIYKAIRDLVPPPWPPTCLEDVERHEEYVDAFNVELNKFKRVSKDDALKPMSVNFLGPEWKRYFSRKTWTLFPGDVQVVDAPVQPDKLRDDVRDQPQVECTLVMHKVGSGYGCTKPTMYRCPDGAHLLYPGEGYVVGVEQGAVILMAIPATLVIQPVNTPDDPLECVRYTFKSNTQIIFPVGYKYMIRFTEPVFLL